MMKKTIYLLRQYSTISIKAIRILTSIPNDLRQVLIGQLLSDASLYRSSPTSNTRVEWSFGLNYFSYASWIANLLNQYCGTGLMTLPSGQHRLKTLSLPVFNELYNLFYTINSTGKAVKVVPTIIDELITPIVLAHLIIGDGSYDRANQTVFIYTNAFTYNDCVRLANSITKMGVNTTVRVDRMSKDGIKQYKLAISKNQLSVLQTIVTPHMHNTIFYRLGKVLDPY